RRSSSTKRPPPGRLPRPSWPGQGRGRPRQTRPGPRALARRADAPAHGAIHRCCIAAPAPARENPLCFIFSGRAALSRSSDQPFSQAERGHAYRLLKRLLDVRPEELAALGWSWLYLFSVLSAYYILRPIRDEMGVAGGVENLQWLFSGTLLGMMAVNPPFAALVAKLPRVRFISITYRFFIGNLLFFVVLLL